MTAGNFPRYHYRAALAHVVDGDTAVFDVELGFGVSARWPVRLVGYNAPEIRGPEPHKARAALAHLDKLLLGRAVYLATLKDGQSFARYLAAAYVDPGDGELIDVADAMKAAGYDVPRGG
jgi:endonuclease YncB( thermonuclease family)